MNLMNDATLGSIQHVFETGVTWLRITEKEGWAAAIKRATAIAREPGDQIKLFRYDQASCSFVLYLVIYTATAEAYLNPTLETRDLVTQD